MSIVKYLRRHAEAEAGLDPLQDLCAHGPWAHAVVIPARSEDIRCLDAAVAPALASGSGGSVLCVLIVNASTGGDGRDREAGERLLMSVEARPQRWRCAGLSLHRVGALDILLADRCRGERGFGPRDGVGLARKIGADLVLRLFERGALRWPWIHCTDADARLPAEHFERVLELGPNAKVSATVAPFWHVPGDDPKTNEATARYELSLRYYVAGLRSAGSTYAFHTIGSLISVSCTAYAAVRGFPRRQAGEDFYLLNKLAKLTSSAVRAPVQSLRGAPVEIRSRRSTRVPFGTGPAVEALLDGEPLRVYDPRVFETLAQVVDGLACVTAGEGTTRLELLAREFEDVPQLRACVEAAQGLMDRYEPRQLELRLHESFDGFRTLKLIHGLTAARWPKIDWARAREHASFIELDPRLSLDEQRLALVADADLEVGPPCRRLAPRCPGPPSS